MKQAEKLLRQGLAIAEVSRRTGLSRRRLGRIKQGSDQRQGQAGRPPLSPRIKAQIRQLLGQGQSIRQVAQIMGVSTYSVARIKTPAVRALKSDALPASKVLATVERCPHCGGLIFMKPCRVCLVRGERP